MIAAQRGLALTVGIEYPAASGAVLVLFVFFHMLGNLQIYLGPDALNSYAAAIHSTGALLWIARAGLLVALGAHVWGLATLSIRTRAARPRHMPPSCRSCRLLLLAACC